MTLIAELAGAANLGTAMGIGQIAFAIALVALLLVRRPRARSRLLGLDHQAARPVVEHVDVRHASLPKVASAHVGQPHSLDQSAEHLEVVHVAVTCEVTQIEVLEDALHRALLVAGPPGIHEEREVGHRDPDHAAGPEYPRRLAHQLLAVALGEVLQEVRGEHVVGAVVRQRDPVLEVVVNEGVVARGPPRIRPR